MKTSELIASLNAFAPEQMVDTGFTDNVGLMVGNGDAEITGVTCCLDVTVKVVEETANAGRNMIVSHHPLIFSPLKTLECMEGEVLTLAAKRGIAIYCMHTNLDFCAGGINDYLIDAYGVKNVEPLFVNERGVGIGRVADLTTPCTLNELVEMTEKITRELPVPFIGNKSAKISRIAVVNGGGGGDVQFVELSVSHGAQVLITSDLKHHVALHAKWRNVAVISPTHYATEHIYIPILSEKIQELAVSAFVSQTECAPITVSLWR